MSRNSGVLNISGQQMFASHQLSAKSGIIGAALAAICAMVTLQASGAEAPVDSLRAKGEDIARGMCSTCHVVAADQKAPPRLVPPGPPFAQIANRPGATEQSVQQFVMRTHLDDKTLPMAISLTKDETAAVVHYLLSLRKS